MLLNLFQFVVTSGVHCCRGSNSGHNICELMICSYGPGYMCMYVMYVYVHRKFRAHFAHCLLCTVLHRNPECCKRLQAINNVIGGQLYLQFIGHNQLAVATPTAIICINKFLYTGRRGY